MKKTDIVNLICRDKTPHLDKSSAFAPSNIALCKYWGKRNNELNLPITSSLSISLGNKGAHIDLFLRAERDEIILNDKLIDPSTPFAKRLSDFLDLFSTDLHFHCNIKTNIPIAAGLASSASGFAAVTLALNQLFDWKLSSSELSILARLGSGSACRSIEPGFVEWDAGIRADGMDSFGSMLDFKWPELRVGLLMLNTHTKPLSSREAMLRTVETSELYRSWPSKVSYDLMQLKEAIFTQDFARLGQVAESNALAMHATMLSAWPPILYSLPDTFSAMQKIWELRREGLSVYFTQDAGPNLKLLFEEKDQAIVKSHFPNLDVILSVLSPRNSVGEG